MKQKNTPTLNVLILLRKLQESLTHKIRVSLILKSMNIHIRTLYRYVDDMCEAGYDVAINKDCVIYKHSKEQTPRLRYKNITLTKEQQKFFELSFPFCDNSDLMAQMGLTHSTFHRFARDMNLKKDPVYDAWRRKCLGRAIAVIKAKRGTNPPKGYKIPNCHRFAKGYKPAEYFGEEKWADMKRRSTSTRNETLRKDRLRRQYGLKPLTKFRNLGAAVPKKITSWRYNARKRGYIVEDKVVHYDDNTQRSEMFENNGRKHGFIILPVGAEVIEHRITSRVKGLKGISFV